MTDEADESLYQDMKCQILMTRYKEQAAHLRDLNQVDLRFFGGFLTIQLVMAGWFAAHPSSIFVAGGVFVIDLALLVVCINIMRINRRRRHEIRDTIININVAFGLYTPGIYLLEKPINPDPPKAASLIWLELGGYFGFAGLVIALFLPFFVSTSGVIRFDMFPHDHASSSLPPQQKPFDGD
jgi:hypothetical protein